MNLRRRFHCYEWAMHICDSTLKAEKIALARTRRHPTTTYEL